jgi:hypothetical protein
MTRREFIQGKMFTLIPEWVQVVIWVLIALILTFLVFRVATYQRPEAEARKPQFYIVNRLQYPMLDGSGGYVLEYAKDGEVQISPSFLSDDDRARFEHYLSKVGEIVK